MLFRWATFSPFGHNLSVVVHFVNLIYGSDDETVMTCCVSFCSCSDCDIRMNERQSKVCKRKFQVFSSHLINTIVRITNAPIYLFVYLFIYLLHITDWLSHQHCLQIKTIKYHDISQWLGLRLSLGPAIAAVYTVAQKLIVKRGPISIIFGTRSLEETIHQKVVNLSTSPEICHCTTLWNAELVFIDCL